MRLHFYFEILSEWHIISVIYSAPPHTSPNVDLNLLWEVVFHDVMLNEPGLLSDSDFP